MVTHDTLSVSDENRHAFERTLVAIFEKFCNFQCVANFELIWPEIDREYYNTATSVFLTAPSTMSFQSILSDIKTGMLH